MPPALPCFASTPPPHLPDCPPPPPDRFALGASERAVDVCYHNEAKDLWAPRLIKKKHGSAVMVRCWRCSAEVSCDCMGGLQAAACRLM